MQKLDFNKMRAKAMPISGDVVNQITQSAWTMPQIGIYGQISDQTVGVHRFVLDMTHEAKA